MTLENSEILPRLRPRDADAEARRRERAKRREAMRDGLASGLTPTDDYYQNIVARLGDATPSTSAAPRPAPANAVALLATAAQNGPRRTDSALVNN